MAEQKEYLIELRKKVIAEMEYKENERFLYIIPYKDFYLSNPNASNEIAVPLHDIYIVFKQIIDNENNVKRRFELYNKDLEKIGHTDENNRLIYDKEITETIIEAQNKIKAVMENGKVADLDENGNLEVYFEMINKKLVTLDKNQKVRLENIKSNKSVKNEVSQGLENKVDVEKQDINERNKMIAANLDVEGVNPEDIDRSTVIRDELFYTNNPTCKDNAIAVKLKNGNLLILTQTDDGRFVKDNAFADSTNEQGRTNVMTTNTDVIEERNTYGAIYCRANENIRYVTQYDDVTGGIKLLMEKRITQNESGKTISQNDYWSPGIEILTDNTDEHIRSEREGKGIGTDNTVRNMWNQRTNENYRMNREAARIINNQGERITPENITDDEKTRINTAIENVKKELKARGKTLSNDDEKKIKRDIKAINKKGLSEENIKEYCDSFEQGEKKEKEMEEERTLESDALKRRAQMQLHKSTTNNKYA